MEHHISTPATKAFVPWNKGRVTGQKPPLKPREVWAIRVRLQIGHHVRDLALFNLAIDSKLRGCDLVHLHVEDVMQGSQVRTRTLISQRKTGAPVQFEITEQARTALASWVASRGLGAGDWLFPSRVDEQKPITTRQYGRLVDEWIASIGLPPATYGTHSLRRTKAALIYRKTGNIRASARPHETGQHRPVPRCRGGRRASDRGEHRRVANCRPGWGRYRWSDTRR